MFLLYVIFFILLIGFVNYFLQKYKKDKKKKRSFWNFGDSKYVVASVSFLIISFFVISFFLPDPSFKSGYEKVRYGIKTGQPWLVTDVYREMIKNDTFNIDLNHTLLEYHNDVNYYMNPDRDVFSKEQTFIFHYYTGLAKSNSQKSKDFGNLFLGIYYYMKNDMVNAQTHFKEVQNKNLKYLNNYFGRVNYFFNEREAAFANFQHEIAINGDLKGTYGYMSRLYDYEKKYDKIKPLVYDEKIKDFIPFNHQQRVYTTDYNVPAFFTNLASWFFKKTNIIGLIAAVLILLTWIKYLTSINIYESKKTGAIVFCVTLSAVFVLPVWFLYSMLKYIVGFDMNGEVLNDFIYCVFGIGLIEEFVKIIPFLIIYRFTKLIKEPIDYIFYASLSALGFAFVENILYFESDNLDIIHARALTASISHVIDTSLIAYGMVLAKFRYKKPVIPYFLIFFLLAIFSHGFYDFWLLNEKVSDYSIVTFLFLLTSILVYASIVNNVLNNSMTREDNINLNTGKISSILAGSLVAIFSFQYLVVSFIYGPHIGNVEFMSWFFSGGYLILFLSVRLSNIDVMPGEWSPIEFFVGLLPMQIIYGEKKLNYNSLVGKTFNIKAFRQKSILSGILPVEGTIMKRENISGFTGWFLVKLNKPIPLKGVNQENILIRAKDRFKLLEKEENDIISFVTIPKMDLLEKGSKKIDDFKFVDWAIVN